MHRQNPFEQVIESRTFGFALAGLGASLGTTLTRRTSVTTQALAAGMGAMLGSYSGDSLHTKLSTEDKVATSAMVGAVAVGASIAANKVINMGTVALIDYAATHGGVVDNVLQNVVKFKDMNPFFNRVVSKTGVKGLILGLGIPMAHKYIQRAVADSHRKYDIAQSSIDQSIRDLNPNRAQKEKISPPHKPGIMKIFGTKEV